MNEEEKNALKVINTRTRRLLDELEIEKEDMSDEPKIAYLMQEIRANKTLLNLIEKLQKENEELKNKLSLKQFDINVVYNDYLEKLNEYKENSIPIQKVKEKIGEINKKILNALKYDEKISVYRYQKQILQELLKESEENKNE